MPTRDKALSSKGRGKDAANAPDDKRQMARFREASAKVLQVPYKDVKAAEERQKAARKRKRS